MRLMDATVMTTLLYVMLRRGEVPVCEVSVQMPVYRQKSPSATFTPFRFSVQHLPSFVLAIAYGRWFCFTWVTAQVLLDIGKFTVRPPPSGAEAAASPGHNKTHHRQFPKAHGLRGPIAHSARKGRWDF